MHGDIATIRLIARWQSHAILASFKSNLEVITCTWHQSKGVKVWRLFYGIKEALQLSVWARAMSSSTSPTVELYIIAKYVKHIMQIALRNNFLVADVMKI